MPDIQNKEELVAKLESLLASADAGEPIDPEDLRNVIACTRDYVPDFDVSGSSKGKVKDLFAEMGESSNVTTPYNNGADTGKDRLSPPSKPRTKTMLPMYGK